MKNILYIDACLRKDESRTRKISEHFINELNSSNLFKIEYVDIDKIVDSKKDCISPLGYLSNKERNELSQKEDINKSNSPFFIHAQSFKKADLIVVASPFWDMGIPAKLKTYFENVSIAGLTFKVEASGNCVGICKASNIVYITTRGLNIKTGSKMEQATPYIKAFSRFLGIKKFHLISCHSLDLLSCNVENKITVAKRSASKLAKKLISYYKN